MSKRFMENVRGWFLRPENDELRQQRGIVRDVNKEAKLEGELDKVLEFGDLDKVQSVMTKMRKLDKDTADRIFKQLADIRLIASKHMRAINETHRLVLIDIDKDKELTIPKKHELEKKFNQDFANAHQTIARFINAIFQSETSLESINASVNSLRRMDTLAQQLRYEYWEAKKDVKRTLRGEQGLSRRARVVNEPKKPEFTKQLDKFMKDLEQEYTDLEPAVKKTMQLLLDDKHDLEQKQARLHALMDRAGIPKIVGEELIKEYDETLLAINAQMHQEIINKRKELSEEQQTRVA